jgi:hypothetical protein
MANVSSLSVREMRTVAVVISELVKEVEPMNALARNWGWVALRGVAALI